MRADVLPHPQVIAVDLVRVRGVAQRDRRQEDEQPAKKSRRMGHDRLILRDVTSATTAASPVDERPRDHETTDERHRLVFWNVRVGAGPRSDGPAANRHDTAIFKLPAAGKATPTLRRGGGGRTGARDAAKRTLG